jgi:hypothetical protein
MGTTRRKFTLEFKTEASHRVIDTGRPIARWPASTVRTIAAQAIESRATMVIGQFIVTLFAVPLLLMPDFSNRAERSGILFVDSS